METDFQLILHDITSHHIRDVRNIHDKYFRIEMLRNKRDKTTQHISHRKRKLKTKY